MAIREFGESLLQDVRARNDKRASDSRKRQRKSDLLSLGAMGLMQFGNSKLSSQWDTFSKNSDVLNTNIMISSAEKANTGIGGLETKITDSGNSVGDYFTNRSVDETLNNLLLREENINWNKDEASRQKFRAAFAPQIRDLESTKASALSATAQYEDALSNREKFAASGTKEDAETMARSKLGNRLTGLVDQSGKQKEAQDSFRNSLYAKSASGLAIFDKILKETGGDFVQAIELSKDFQLDQSALEQLSTTETVSAIENGVVVSAKKVTGADGITTFSDAKQLNLNTEAGQVAAMLGQFDAAAQLQSTITPDGINLMVNKENGFTMVPATTAQVTKNNELYDKFYASHRVAFVSKAESDSMDARRYAMRALTSSTDWQEFVGQTMSANIEIAKAKQSIQENNPEADEIALESLYDADKTIKDLTLEVSLIFQQQNAQMEQIKENNPILGPKTADDADTAKRADGKPSGVGGIIVKSTTSANITTDFIGQTSENTVIGDDAFALDRVKTFVDKRGGTLTQEEMGDLITASKGASEIEAYLVETQGYEPEDSSGVKPDVAFAPTRNKYGSLGLASSDSLKSLLANARSRQEETKIKRKAYNDMSREERSTHRETGVYPTHIQKKIDEGTI